jgi:hypothetical protein
MKKLYFNMSDDSLYMPEVASEVTAAARLVSNYFKEHNYWLSGYNEALDGYSRSFDL